MLVLLRQRVGSADVIADSENSRKEEVNRVMKIILASFVVQKINWASDPMSKRACTLGTGFYLWV